MSLHCKKTVVSEGHFEKESDVQNEDKEGQAMDLENETSAGVEDIEVEVNTDGTDDKATTQVDEAGPEGEERKEEKVPNEETGNEAMILVDRDDAEEADEEEWEEEYVVLDLDDIFHGVPVPSDAYTLSDLDTLNPTLTLDSGLKMTGHYVETVGTVVVYSEKEAPGESQEVPISEDPNAVKKEKKPLKRIRGVCKLERKLKFCAVPMEDAPLNNGLSMEVVPLKNTVPTEDVAVQNVVLEEDAPLDTTTEVVDATPKIAVPTEDSALENITQIVVGSCKIGGLTEDTSLECSMPADSKQISSIGEASLETDMQVEDASPQHIAPVDDASPKCAVVTKDASPDTAMPMDSHNAVPAVDVSYGNDV
ncbi:uncharacterized protein [Physcomitrium patens]|uniref:uncharacterized protein isoform X2 n=1 Tax=Physcomitrium patens TaxID=3218 RepID=UPI000D1716AB|nr:uncharacterized protein LOC112276096 isoform X2 [Physcomitrium patens]|eukprot:XP_024362876.1 uncharacterized protein LOC112276096 isoform X2 [Physcomitrella patens]